VYFYATAKLSYYIQVNLSNYTFLHRIAYTMPEYQGR